MAFESLWKASQDGELLLVDDGFCHYHLRRDGQLTIAEIISQKSGVGTFMLDFLKQLNEMGALFIIAKCPVDLDSNKWYAHKGFRKMALEYSKTGRAINVWRLDLPPYVAPDGSKLVPANDTTEVDETTTVIADALTT